MTVELRPLGVRCNIGCHYCYQQPQRKAGNIALDYDMVRMKEAIVQEGGPFTLFGGEPLMVPHADLKELWSWGFVRWGRNGIQSNGVLVDDEHVRMFRKYRVQVGISIDGPGELNDIRWGGTLERTRAATARTEATIERLCREGMPPSLIVTLHRGNATAEYLPRLHAWCRRLEGLGVSSVRLHLLESETPAIRARWALSDDENVAALRSFLSLERDLTRLRFDVFADMRNQLLGQDRSTTCVWNGCDPYTTRAVRGVEGSGQRSNCGRTNKAGVDYRKADVEGFERYLALYHTQQAAGGCRGCRFFLMCKGQCPGTAIDGDWRNRTEHCAVWMRLFEDLEGELERAGHRPISHDPQRRTRLERAHLDAWMRGKNPGMATIPAGWAADVADTETGEGRTGAVDRSWMLDHPRAGGRGPAVSDRLDFVLPDFTRIAWASDAARAVWGPRFERIGRAWEAIERHSVAVGLRACGVGTVSPDRVAALRGGGLDARALDTIARRHQPYVASAAPPRPHEPSLQRVVIGAPDSIARFAVAWRARDDDAVGALLGYPSCCREFFTRVWVRDGCVDTTWPMAQASAPKAGGDREFDIVAPWQANILWRWAGVRSVSHLPCRFDCERTVQLAETLLALGDRLDFPAEMSWLREILSWPVQWTALHGIAEIETPILKISTRTDATVARYIVRWHGDGYPPEGVRGLRFPYRRATHQASVLPIAPRAIEPAWLYTDNGFATLAAMETAHRPIVAFAENALARRRGAVVDLGCGNGVLVRRICAMASRLVPMGIDIDPVRVAHARVLAPTHSDGFLVGNVCDADRLLPGRRFALALLQPGRLLEADGAAADQLRTWLRQRCAAVLLYAYPDTLAAHGSLAVLARRTGFTLLPGAADGVGLARPDGCPG